MTNFQFEEVRQWKEIRGIGGHTDAPMINRLQSQYQRFLQEGVEIHEAIVLEDDDEFIDAVGDTIVTLINLAAIKGLKAEDCLQKAFEVINLRKGLTRESGDFVRYAKLPKEDQLICDEKQGNPGEQYFLPEHKASLYPDCFKK